MGAKIFIYLMKIITAIVIVAIENEDWLEIEKPVGHILRNHILVSNKSTRCIIKNVRRISANSRCFVEGNVVQHDHR